MDHKNAATMISAQSEPPVPFFRPSITEEDVEAVVHTLRSGWLTRGRKCEEFENAFARVVGARHAVSVNSGAAALLTAFSASGVRPGDVVVMPALAFTATAQAALVCGATVVFADCDRDSLCLDPAAARSALCGLVDRTSLARPLRGAIVPIHYGGAIGDLEGCRSVAEEFGLKLVHDGAHCLHSAYRDAADAPWIKIGALDEPVCYSFYAVKCITSGEGGMVTTNDAAFAAKVRRVSFHGVTVPAEAGRTGMNWDYNIDEQGYKANLSDLLAALGLSQLARAEEFHRRRRRIAAYYREMLGEVIPADLPEEPVDRRSDWHIFPLRLHLDRLSLSRDEILLRMRDLGVHGSVHWRPLHHFSHYKSLVREGRAICGPLSVTDETFPRLLSLPIAPAFRDEEVERVAATVVAVLRAAARPSVRHCTFIKESTMRYDFQTTRRTQSDYIVTSSILDEPEIDAWRGRETAVVFDACLEHHHPKALSSLLRSIGPKGVLAVEGGEALKSFNAVKRVLDFLAHTELAKSGLVLAVGGGTVCDVVNLAATLFRRGVGLALAPTTLLGQIDAAVGGKNGVNFAETKNLVGNFYHPETVICDIAFLRTLAPRDVTGGLAEAIKVLAVSDRERFQRNFAGGPLVLEAFSDEALTTLVGDAVGTKLSLLAEDPYEESSRRLLNYGHAFAHNFEEWSNFALSHGEAVLIGMTIENAISMEAGLAGLEIASLQTMISSLFTDDCRRYWIDRQALPPILAKLRLARRGRLNIVCLRSIGEADILDDVDGSVMMAAWDRSYRALVGTRIAAPLAIDVDAV